MRKYGGIEQNRKKNGERNGDGPQSGDYGGWGLEMEDGINGEEKNKINLK